MTLLGILLFYILAAELYVYGFSRNGSLTDYDYILLLGANGDLTSTVTRDRASNAAKAKSRWPQAQFILSGNEKRGEVAVYKILLSKEGHTDFLEEGESKNTWNNMQNSRPLMAQIDPRVLIVTSEYHQPRALAMARSLGMKAEAFGEDPRRYKKALLFFIKERFSNLKYFPQMLFHKIF